MRNLSTVHAALLLADRHIADARRSIAHQAYRVDQWKEWEGDPKPSQALLALMQETLDAFLVHRCLLIDELAEHHLWHWLREEPSMPITVKPLA